jgi:hypothetical protein
MTSARDFLDRGLLAGQFAGLMALGVAYVIGEPSVNAAIAIENRLDRAMITRSSQQPVMARNQPASPGIYAEARRLDALIKPQRSRQVVGLCRSPVSCVH